MSNIEQIIEQRILVLDGAMGTMIQRYQLKEEDFRGTRFNNHDIPLKGNNDILCITRPDIIRDIHMKYLEAGADLIETNTFNANAISQKDYHTEKYIREINLSAVKIAREIANEYTQKTPDKPRFVLGSIGPTNKSCSMSPDVNDPSARSITFDELSKEYFVQMEALIEGGVDAFIIETIFDTLNAKAALYAAESAMESMSRRIPIMLSITLSDKGGRTLAGQTLDAFLASIAHANVFSVGLNCSFGAKDMKPYLKELASKAPYYISAYPNAGLPNQLGQYDQTPEMMEKEIKEFIDEGLVNIVGGCCGTTDTYIAKYPRLIQNALPHHKNPKDNCLQLSGLELLKVKKENNFINIGERCNVAGSRKFLRLIKEKNYEEALGIARKQVEDGAQVLDINMDDGLLDAHSEMVNFLNLIASDPDIAKVPIMIDSSKWNVIIAGLKCLQGKCIVNSISLKEGEDIFLSHARDIQRLGAAAVIMAFDENGQATSYDRKIEVCKRAYNLLREKLDFNPNDIIFDPNILSVATGMEEHNNYAVDYINATKWIRTNLPFVHVSGGVSNLSFSFRGNNYIREAMHAVFLYHAIQNGMDMGIVNPATSILYTDIPKDVLDCIEDVILNRSSDASEKLIELANKLKDNNLEETKENDKQIKWRTDDLESRLKYSLIKGITDYLEDDLKEALDKYEKAVDIIEGPLMSGMNQVGELFGAGKMFLPQVVKTARTMKKAVSILQPVIESQKSNSSSSAGKILLATVKGDVHDIGKNIVSVIMACNGYEIIDLGIMVPAETIVRRAKEEHVDIIGLSGLITPSLEEMVNVAIELQNEGLNIPLVIGGATTSRLHTALKIAPVYNAPVAYIRDASQIAPIASKLINPSTKETFVKTLNDEYAKLRDNHENKKENITPLDESRKKKLNLFD
jgi:5-methyltetrahydrofolate--homocysteine methyltransferase